MSRFDELTGDDSVHACAECGVSVDPLRAARVRLFGARFRYFCSSACADRYTPNDEESSPALHVAVRLSPERIELVESTGDATPPVPARIEPAPKDEPRTELAPDATEPTAVALEARAPTATPERAPAETTSPRARRSESPASRDRRPVWTAERLLGAALAFGALTIGFLLAAESTLTVGLRLMTSVLGNAALLAFTWRHESDDTKAFTRTGLGLNLALLVVAAAAVVLEDPELGSALNTAGASLVASAGTTLLLRRLYRPVDAQRAELRAWSGGPAYRIQGDGVDRVDSGSLRPGEEIVVHAGETVVADVTIVAGRAEIYPWFGANTIHTVGPEDFVYAGAKLASGQIRATVRWTGLDRHWERLLDDPTRRVDRHSPLVQSVRRATQRGAPLLAVLALASSLTASASPVHWALVGLVSLAALWSPALHRLPALRLTESVLAALGNGIVFRTAEALDAAGKVSTAVFCARGTLLLGEPELSDIDVSGGVTQDEVLALAAGAEQGQHHPTSVALMRAARARRVPPDAVRSPRSALGLGVTAIASNGKPLIVGSRALLLRERVSIARAEARITELEAMGRSVLLVALDNHLVGILALQDGLRAGARAAVQHLLDAGVEPVLLSGDARKSCEALGRTIDIEHLRPEVLPADRGREVERLKSGGAQVAVIGRSPMDEVALASASVSVALPSPGTPNMDYDVELLTNEVQKAALALNLAHQSKRQATRSVLWGCGGAIASVSSVVALSAPVAWIPLACMAFILAAALNVPARRTAEASRA